MSGGQMLAALRPSWPKVELAGEPRQLTGGFWASIWHLRVAGAPPEVPSDLVLRVAPDPLMAAKETAVQAAMADAGVPTPRVHLSGGSGGPLGGAWAVMDLASGAPLLAGLDGASALRRLPRLATSLPGQLASTMAALHRIDPAPVVSRVRDAAPSAAFGVDEVWPHLRAGAVAAGRDDLTHAVERLIASRPPDEGGAVICHGDLHPFNLLTDADAGGTTVLDWTAAIAAPPAYDVAFTSLLLRYPPLAAPPALRPVIGAGAASLARRFVRLYRRANPAADLSGLRWYGGLHAARILTEHAVWTRNGDPRARHHPWRLIAPGAARTLGRAIGDAPSLEAGLGRGP